MLGTADGYIRFMQLLFFNYGNTFLKEETIQKMSSRPNVKENNYGYNTASSNYDLFFENDRWKSFGTLGLNVIIPIFDGFLKRSKINQSKFKIEQIENQMLFLERSINCLLYTSPSPRDSV